MKTYWEQLKASFWAPELKEEKLESPNGRKYKIVHKVAGGLFVTDDREPTPATVYFIPNEKIID